MKTTIENFIGIFEDAFTKEYCDSVIQYFERMDEVGSTSSRQQELINTKKTEKNDTILHGVTSTSLVAAGGFVSTFNEVLWGQAYPIYAGEFDTLKSSGSHGNYSFKIQRTKVGGGYHLWHFENSAKEISNRLLVWTLYLNDVEEGGETEFLYYPKRVKPKTGTFVLWPAGFTHTHRGNPPISNTKYIVTGWIEF